MKKIFTLLGALLLWQSMAVAQNYLNVYRGDSLLSEVLVSDLDSITIRDRLFYGYTDDDWVSIGTGTYREDFVTTFFGVQNLVYAIEIESVPEAPGMYRLVNPYGASYPYNVPGDYDTSLKHYMVINAQDPEGVYIERHYSGMDWGYGEFIFHSYAGYYIEKGYSLEDVKAAGFCGTLKDGKITFPAGKLLIGMADYNGGGLFDANVNGQFEVVLPGYAESAKAPARNSRPQIVELNVNAEKLPLFTTGKAPTKSRTLVDKAEEKNARLQLQPATSCKTIE